MFETWDHHKTPHFVPLEISKLNFGSCKFWPKHNGWSTRFSMKLSKHLQCSTKMFETNSSWNYPNILQFSTKMFETNSSPKGSNICTISTKKGWTTPFYWLGWGDLTPSPTSPRGSSIASGADSLQTYQHVHQCGWGVHGWGEFPCLPKENVEDDPKTIRRCFDFKCFFMSNHTWWDDPFLTIIFFKWVETTN